MSIQDDRRNRLAQGIAHELRAPAVGRVHQSLAESVLAWLDDEKADREPSADTGCPHEAYEIDTAGNPTRCADCGDHLAAVPDREPSDAKVEAAGRGLYENRVSLIESETQREMWPAWEGLEKVDADEWRDAARAALRAAQEVRCG